jgi:aldehyde dehydrogenase
VFTQAAHSTKEDLELVVDKAMKPLKLGENSATEKHLLNKIQKNYTLEYIATVETIDNGKPFEKQWQLISHWH